MSEDVYVNARPDLTKKGRYGRGERQMEMEERGEREDRGEREERIVDIYEPGEQEERIVDIYEPGNNTAQEQDGDCEESKKDSFRAVAVCVGLLCLLLLAGIIVLLILSVQWKTRFEDLQTGCNNVTEQKDQWKTSFDELQNRYNKLIERDDIKKILCESYGFTFLHGLCYYISTEKKNWDESRQYCRDKQSDLMIIKSKDKQDFVVRLVDKALGRSKLVWLGLMDKETEGMFKWVDGTPLTTPTYWYFGQPDNKDNEGREEDCVEYYSGNQLIYRGWNDRSCSLSSHWICERAIY